MEAPVFLNHRFSFGDHHVAIWERAPQESFRGAVRDYVFLHGRFGDATTWQPLMAQISPADRCAAIDFPGFGESFSVGGSVCSFSEMVSLVEAFLNQFVRPDRSLVIIGHDIGCAVAQTIALRGGFAIEALILINASPEGGSGFLPGLRGRRMRAHLRRLLAKSSLGPPWREALIAPWEVASTRKVRGEVLRSFMQRARSVGKLSELHTPTLVLWGSADELNRHEAAVEWMKLLSNSVLHLDSSSGHWPHLENPDWVNEMIEEFLFGLEEEVRAG